MNGKDAKEPVTSAVDAANDTLADLRLSLDSDRSKSNSRPGTPISPLVNGVNGKSQHARGDSEHEPGVDRIEQLEKMLKQTREEKDTLATQYQTLLTRLTTMRNTLGNKLRQDAEELDRREQEIQQLNLRVDDYAGTIETLKTELISTNEENERLSRDLEAARSRALEESSAEVQYRERALLETQNELERCRIERDEWEGAALQEKVISEELRAAVEMGRRDLELERAAREREAGELEVERERTKNLQSVLEDFQSSREHELRQAVGDLEAQLTQTTQSLAEFKARALNAELQIEETTSSTARVGQLEQDLKEKNLLIGKLRHEGVIMNEHLTEALRRLKRHASSDQVDRRLVTNVLLQFITLPRADTKRFEMLALIASVLGWSDVEREKAGLQRSGTLAPPSGWGRSGSASPSTSPKGKPTELEKTDETESFSKMWVEFLLKESNGANDNGISPTSPNSLPSTPTHATHGQTPSSGRRLASFNSAALSRSNENVPNLALPPPPRRGSSSKGKEKAES